MNKQNKILTIAICAISVAFVAICTLFIIVMIKLNDSTSNSSFASTSNVSSQTQSIAIPTTSTSSKSSSKKPSYANVSSKASSKPPYNSSNSSRPTTSTPIISNTPSTSSLDEVEKEEFIQWYSQAEASYKTQLLYDISICNQEKTNWQNKLSSAHSSKVAEQQAANIKFEAMGMLNSGAHQRALKTIEDNYKSQIAQCQDKISTYSSQLELLQEQLDTMNPYAILAVLSEEQGISTSEATRKYLKYIAQ